MTVANSWGDRALQHARHIAARIGPRGAATPEEKRAADYAQQQLQLLGVQHVRLEAFNTPNFGWLVMAIAFSSAVWSVFFCWGAFYLTQTRIIGGVLGALLSAFALAIIYLEANLRDNPLRKLITRGRSYNAIGRQAPAGPITQRVVVISNLDTPPAARTFQTPRRRKIFRVVFLIGTLSLIVSIGLYLLGGLEIWEWAFVWAGVCGVLQSLVILQSLQADRGEFTPGANNNASGLGVVLTLAERVKSSPLQNTEVWFACCGAHTAGNSGLRALWQQHGDELREAWFVGFEGVGVGRRVIAVNRESGLSRWPARSIHPAMRAMLTRLQQEHPALAIEPLATARETVVADATRRGLKSLCFSVYAEANHLPYAYRQNDTTANLEVEALDAAQAAGWEVLQQIDRG